MRMFHRALYTIEYPSSDSSVRLIKRKLPPEIIYVIAQDVKAEAIVQGCRGCERQLGERPNRSTYVELEEGLRRLERWGGALKGLGAWPAEDTVLYLSQHTHGDKSDLWHLVFKVHAGPLLTLRHAGNVGCAASRQDAHLFIPRLLAT